MLGNDSEISGKQAGYMKRFPLLEGDRPVFAFGYAGIVFLRRDANLHEDHGRAGLPGDCRLYDFP